MGTSLLKEMQDPEMLRSQLTLIDTLEIGDAKVEANRISTSYTLLIDGRHETFRLSYRYEEDVFDTQDHLARNLANMILVQPALNYGLFCREIVFRGNFDAHDRHLIRSMMENTSKEIYVNKICWRENPFLAQHIKELPVFQLKKYTQATLKFVHKEHATMHTWQHWDTDKEVFAVLSSGGKDSLLSYGLLKELNKTVHPLFINESGRHWFTALNAYRFLKDTEPLTQKVWTNVDRFFTWMLRHLSFIRSDFHTLRADDYPLRLWTVATFSMGVLPLMRKYKIGNLTIGDEYDTTRRRQFHGITHYEGLYDQSRFFDEAFSRYFLKKGWGIRQYSILRPLSELLIQKILVKRYPELQVQQISCHAAHIKDSRVYPCGKCEKCRRIVSMMLAWEEDPKQCGYTETQIEQILEKIPLTSSKQIGSEAKFLMYMLVNKKLLNIPGFDIPKEEIAGEVLQLKFDSECSPVNIIPLRLRKPLYTIYRAYATGCVMKVGKKWRAIDSLDDNVFAKPYPFDWAEAKPVEDVGLLQPHKNFIWGEQTWPEMQTRLGQVDIALLPVGAIEQHGPHLPLDIDSFDAAYLANCVADACSEPRPWVLPLVPYGVSYHHNRFPGTISISNETMAGFIYDIGKSLAANGIKKLVIINGHGDNRPTLNFAAQMLNRDCELFVCVDTGESSDTDIDKLITTKEDAHAGEVETSTALATRPHLVKMDLAQPDINQFSNAYLDFSSDRGVSWFAYTDQYSESGVIGDPTLATAQKGKRIWEIMIAHLVSLVEELKTHSMEEVFQRRQSL